MATPETPPPSLRERLHEVIFEADTRAGKRFDVVLMICIVLSVAAVLLESVPEVARDHGGWLRAVEWLFTGLFTIEYGLRLYSVRNPLRYATSFFGVIDLLAIVPSYLSLFVPGGESLLVIRVLRLLRVFRVFKMARYLGEANVLIHALRSSLRKVLVFLGTVLTLVVVMGSVMHLIEGGANGFASIPASIYWAVVTLTTVGYGDIVPSTPLGQFVASFIMITGYSIIAVPTGIVSAEMTRATMAPVSTQACRKCSREGHDADARHCKFCGAEL